MCGEVIGDSCVDEIIEFWLDGGGYLDEKEGVLERVVEKFL